VSNADLTHLVQSAGRLGWTRPQLAARLMISPRTLANCLAGSQALGQRKYQALLSLVLSSTEPPAAPAAKGKS
jgi:hypothetical protein